MEGQTIVFTHTGLTVRATPQGATWQGQLLDERGQVEDEFAYTRETFPGAIIGAFRFTDLRFTVQLAARMWLYTEQRHDWRATSAELAAEPRPA